MAQLKDLIVTGPARIIGTLYAQNASTDLAGLVKLGGGTTNFLRADGTWATPAGTAYTANTGITLNGNTFQHTNSVTAATAGTSSATSGSTLAVPYVTYDAQGHITATGTHTHTVTGFLTSSSSLDASKLTGTIPTSVLPGSIDEIKEGYLYNNKFYVESAHTTEIAAAADKIYVDVSTNKTYRYGGSTAGYVEISASLALGNTASTAAKGNHTHTVTATGNVTTTTATTANKTATVSVASSGDATYTPAGTISIATAGTTNNTLKPVTAKTVVTGATFNTVVTGGTTTDVPNISKKTVVTSASGATATVTNGTLTITNGSFSTGDSVTVGTAIKAYTTLNTGVSGSATTGDSVTLGSAVTVKTSDATYQFSGTGARLVTGNIPVPATYTSTFSGTSATTSVPA